MKVVPQRILVGSLLVAANSEPRNRLTEASNGRLEHLRGSALGFRNPTNYIARITAGGRRLQTPTTPRIVKSPFRLTCRFVVTESWSELIAGPRSRTSRATLSRSARM